MDLFRMFFWHFIFNLRNKKSVIPSQYKDLKTHNAHQHCLIFKGRKVTLLTTQQLQNVILIFVDI